MTETPPLQHELIDSPTQYAAIDLGSNSFHMLIAELVEGELRPLQRFREKVRLAEGLDDHRLLDEAARERGFQCLRRFAQRLRNMPSERVAIRATNTLRVAINANDFIAVAEGILGHPVEVISGVEEARLIYLGVAHTLADDAGRRLVVDIGGGSTELIVGERFEPQVLESLAVGCVAYEQRFFANGELSEARFKRARLAACSELVEIADELKPFDWSSVVGASGTVRAIARILQQNGWSDDEQIGRDGLEKLRMALLKCSHVGQIRLAGLERERASILPAGLAILTAIFDTLGIAQMRYSDGALREGVLYDLIGRSSHEDVRARTIDALSRRFRIDRPQARRVERTVLALHDQVVERWALHDPRCRRWLGWAAQLHEIGLAVSHSQFHRHGAYLVRNVDLPGFTQQTQQMLALLVRGHRRRFPAVDDFAVLRGQGDVARRLVLLLRLAVLLNHGRAAHEVPRLRIEVDGPAILLRFPPRWLADHPLTQADFDNEAQLLRPAGFELQIC